jgi:general secretion pathway protein B
MSLILEALRKSEAERRRGAVPNVYAELPPTPTQSRMTLQQAMGLTAAAVLLFGAMWWARGRQSGDHDFVRAPADVSAHVIAAAALPRVQHLTPVPAPTARKAPVPPTSADVDAHRIATAPALDSSDDVLPPPPSFAKPLAPSPTAAPASAVAHTSLPDSDHLQALSDLPVDARKSLPPLKMSMHMWNEAPAQRFIILDGNHLQEGDRVGDAVLTAIVPDGAILDWNGRRLKLTIR